MTHGGICLSDEYKIKQPSGGIIMHLWLHVGGTSTKSDTEIKQSTNSVLV